MGGGPEATLSSLDHYQDYSDGSDEDKVATFCFQEEQKYINESFHSFEERMRRWNSVCSDVLGGLNHIASTLCLQDRELLHDGLQEATRLLEEGTCPVPPKLKLALIGRTKAGKSALGRALLQAKVFKSSVAAQTSSFWSVESGLEYAVVRGSTVHSFADLKSLEAFCQTLNRVAEDLTIHMPIPFDPNLCIIDTMGYSESEQGASAVRHFCQHDAHAVVFVVDSTSGGLMLDDTKVIGLLPRRIREGRIVFVLTRVDRLRMESEEEGEAEDTLQKLQAQIQELVPLALVLHCGGLGPMGCQHGTDESERDAWLDAIRRAIHADIGGQHRTVVMEAQRDRIVLGLGELDRAVVLSLSTATTEEIREKYDSATATTLSRLETLPLFLQSRCGAIVCTLTFRLRSELRLVLERVARSNLACSFRTTETLRSHLLDTFLQVSREYLAREAEQHVDDFWSELAAASGVQSGYRCALRHAIATATSDDSIFSPDGGARRLFLAAATGVSSGLLLAGFELAKGAGSLALLVGALGLLGGLVSELRTGHSSFGVVTTSGSRPTERDVTTTCESCLEEFLETLEGRQEALIAALSSAMTQVIRQQEVIVLAYLQEKCAEEQLRRSRLEILHRALTEYVERLAGS